MSTRAVSLPDSVGKLSTNDIPSSRLQNSPQLPEVPVGQPAEQTPVLHLHLQLFVYLDAMETSKG